MKRIILVALCLLAVSVLPSLTSASVDITLRNSQQYTAESHCPNNCGGFDTMMTPLENSWCFLTRTGFEDLDDGSEVAQCTIDYAGNNRKLSAYAEDDADAWCAAQCITWNVQGLQGNVFSVHGVSAFGDETKNILCNEEKGIKCNLTNSYCGLDDMELGDVHGNGERWTWCDVKTDANGDWVLESAKSGDAHVACTATCLYWGDAPPEAVAALNFSSSSAPQVHAHINGDNPAEAELVRANATNSCSLDLARIYQITEKGEKAFCEINDYNGWRYISGRVDYGAFGDGSDADAWCEGRCLSWNNVQLVQICGNGRKEGTEQCDLGGQNGQGLCTETCKALYCEEQTDFTIGACGGDYKPGMLCKNFGDNVNPEPAFVPNCDGLNGQPVCSCGSGKVCATGSVIDEGLVDRGSPVYPLYVPLDNDFQNESNLPNLSYDGGTGTGLLDTYNGRNGGWSYKIIKGSPSGKVFATFTVPVEAGSRYEAETYVKTQNNRPADSVRIFSGSYGSAFAKPSVSWDRISYKFPAEGSSYTLYVEVSKQGAYYIDDVKIKKLGNICQDKCRIVPGSSFTRKESADKGTEVNVTVKFMGACQAPFYFQIDAVDNPDDVTCGLDHNNAYGLPNSGWMQGIDIKCEEPDIKNEAGGVKSCSKTWVVPDVTAACAAKKITASYGAIWYNGIGSDNDAEFVDQWTFGNPNMYLQFVSEPMPPTCNNNQFDPGVEDCDPTAQGHETIACAELNAQLNETYIEGNATCKSTCRWDTHLCREKKELCGTNNRVDSEYGEECDPSASLQTQCSDLTYTDANGAVNHYSGGTLGCYPANSENFCKFDKSRCTKPAICGDSIRDSGEDCDGNEFGDIRSCNEYNNNFLPTPLACDQSTCTYDLSVCQPDGCVNAPDGLCEIPFESRSSCPEDCAVTFRDVRSETSGQQTAFTGTLASDMPGTPWFDKFIACKYAPRFSNRPQCISQYNNNDCGFDRASGAPKDCICSGTTGSCSVSCLDTNGTFYLYAEGFVGATNFKVQSDKAPFSCEQVGLSELRLLKKEIDDKTYIAFRNWQYAEQNGLQSAGTWRSVESVLSSMQSAIKQFFDNYESDVVIGANEVRDMVAQAHSALSAADDLVKQLG